MTAGGVDGAIPWRSTNHAVWCTFGLSHHLLRPRRGEMVGLTVGDVVGLVVGEVVGLRVGDTVGEDRWEIRTRV